MSDVSASRGLGKTRIEALADGIFAIAMTLMVFDIKLPTGGNPAKPESRTDPALASIPGVHDQLHYAGCLLGGTPQSVSLYPLVSLVKSRIAMGPAASILAICVSFVAKRLSLAIFALIPLLYLIPGRIDYHWLDPRDRHPKKS